MIGCAQRAGLRRSPPRTAREDMAQVDHGGAGSTWGAFVPFGSLHLLTVAVCALFIALLATAGRALRERSAEAKLRKPWAVFALCYWFVYIIWWNWNGLDLYGC